jgi:hypothetical protein
MYSEKWRRESMAQERKQIRLRRQDLKEQNLIDYEGENVLVHTVNSYEDGSVRLVLDTFRGWQLVVYGQFYGREFMELDRNRLD